MVKETDEAINYQKLFDEVLNATIISTKLESCNANDNINDVIANIVRKGFDYIGVNDGKEIIGYTNLVNYHLIVILCNIFNLVTGILYLIILRCYRQ